jgi:hypothetical protein
MTIMFARWITLRPFIAWCAAEDIAPSAVSTDDIARFIDAKPTRFPLKSSNFRRAQNLRRAWNFAVQRVRGWPTKVIPLDRPCHGRGFARTVSGYRVTYDITTYQPSLVAEIERYRAAGGFLSDTSTGQNEKVSHQEKMASRLTRLASLPDELLGYFPQRLRRLNPKTTHDHGRLIYRTATALHEAGAVDIGELRRITDVTTAKAAAVLADRICARWRAGARPSTYAALSVYTLCAIGRRCGVVYTMAETIAVRQLAHELIRDAEVTYDLSAKNLDMLLPFEDPHLFAMLVALPG